MNQKGKKTTAYFFFFFFSATDRNAKRVMYQLEALKHNNIMPGLLPGWTRKDIEQLPNFDTLVNDMHQLIACHVHHAVVFNTNVLKVHHCYLSVTTFSSRYALPSSPSFVRSEKSTLSSSFTFPLFSDVIYSIEDKYCYIILISSLISSLILL